MAFRRYSGNCGRTRRGSSAESSGRLSRSLHQSRRVLTGTSGKSSSTTANPNWHANQRFAIIIFAFRQNYSDSGDAAHSHWWTVLSNPLPPLDCLRHFEVAARHQSFAHAAVEIGVQRRDLPSPTASEMLERHLRRLDSYERRHHSVFLNRQGRAYYNEMRRILLDIQETTLAFCATAGGNVASRPNIASIQRTKPADCSL